MSIITEDTELLINKFKIMFEVLKEDVNEQKDDIYYSKHCAEKLLLAISNLKMNEAVHFSKHQQQELVELLDNVRRLIGYIEKEIEIQTKEEYFISNNNQI